MKTRRIFIAIVLVLLLATVGLISCQKSEDFEAEGIAKKRFTGLVEVDQLTANKKVRIHNYTNISVPTSVPTTIPGLIVNSAALGNIVEVQDASTPVWVIEDGGGVTHSGNMVVVGPTAATTATPVVYVNNAADVNDLLVISKDATPEVVIHNDGLLDVDGNKIDLDVDADTSITADTDDQIDIEVGGADRMSIKDWTATAMTDTVEYLFEIADTTGIGQSGTNSQAALNIDLGIGNSTAGTNTVYGILIDTIVADAQNTETAIAIGGNGWDVGLDLGGNCLDLDDAATTSICADTDNTIDIEINGADDFQLTANTMSILSGSTLTIDDGAAMSIVATNAADGSANPIDYTATTGIMNGSDSLEVIDINITSAAHTSTGNVINAISLGLTSPHANAEESAIYFTANWDNDLNAATTLDLSVDDAVVLVLSDPPAANGTGDLLDLTATNLGGDGGDVFIAFDINLTGTAGSSTNTTTGIDLSLTSPQGTQVETAIMLDTDWDVGIDMDGSCLDLDAAATTSICADTDNTIDIEINGADDFQLTANTFEVLDGSTILMNGMVLDLDADEDTSITASTDDQIDVEIGGTDYFVLQDWTTIAMTDTVEYLMEIAGTSGIGQSGTNSVAALNIDMTIGDSTAGTNTVYGILIDDVTGDAESTDVAVDIGSGWDEDINADTALNISVDGVGVLDISDPPAANTSGDILDITVTNAGGDGSEAFILFDLNVTNSAGTNTNTTTGIDLSLTSPQATQTEVGILLDTDWDVGIDMDGSCLDLDAAATTSICADTDNQIDIEIAGTDFFVLQDWTTTALTDTTEYLFEIAGTTGIGQSGTNSVAALNIDLGIGNSTGGTNTVYGILIDAISADPQNTQTAIDIGTGWDVGLSLSGTCLDLDSDNDTSICADTEDTIDIEINGADDFQFTANTFTIAAGSKINSSAVATGTHGIVFVCSGSHAHTDVEAAAEICSIPANANVVDVIYVINTQWNDGASAAVDCGISGGDVDAFVDAMNINDAADFHRMGEAADMPYASALIDVGASDVLVVCQVAEGADDASAGAATLYLWYIID